MRPGRKLNAVRINRNTKAYPMLRDDNSIYPEWRVLIKPWMFKTRIQEYRTKAYF
jgi:hypothetical protein